ncbi:hypothetical protein SEVIR_5G387401v4 [Setaria viridis]
MASNPSVRLVILMIWIGGSTDPIRGAHGAAGEAALRHAGGPRGVRHAQRPGTAEGALRGGEDVLGRPEGEGVRRGGGAQPPVARHGQPRPRPDPEDSAGKCDELRAVECIMPCDRRQVKVVSVLRSLQEYQSATGTWAKPKDIFCLPERRSASYM